MAFPLPRLKLDLPFAARAETRRPTPTGWIFTPLPAAPRSTVRRSAGFVLVAGLALVAATWGLIRTFPGFGPALADHLRSVIGSEAVTKLEELSAGAEDRVRSALPSEPRALADLTPVELQGAPRAPSPNAAPAFRPSDVGPMVTSLKAASDGRWQPASLASADEPLVYRTLLHPDSERAHAELFVFALDLAKVELHAVAGTVEPKNREPAEGPGRVAEAHLPRLLAAFNGGFKAEHGRFGMMVNGVELLAARPQSCTVARTESGALRVGTWRALEQSGERFAWWRQTPACMVEAGALHPGLAPGASASRSWGATLEGDTVIRRSALGLDAGGTTLYVGISNFTTARAMATGMQHAGAVHVAQLDVNHSFPKFLLYRDDPKREAPAAVGAVKGFLFDEDDYVRTASTRDFFYVTRR